MKPLDMPKKADKAEAAPAEVKKEEVIDFSKVEIEPLLTSAPSRSRRARR